MDHLASRTGVAWRACAWIVGVAALTMWGARGIDAHKPVTSPYDYNKDVFPLLRAHCGRCHVEGGAAPMSLVTYKDAVPWAESIRDELSEGRMPPWPVSTKSRPVKGGHPISAHDLDVIVTWASGGTPHDWSDHPNQALPAVALKTGWSLGPPNLTLAMDTPHSLAANTLEETCDFSLSPGTTEAKWIRAADLLPGAPSMVRDAVISVDNGPVLALWEPGGERTAAPGGTAFRLAAGAKIHLHIHYMKHYDQGQNVIADKSTVGLYFADMPAPQAIESIAVHPAGAGDPSATQTFSATLATGGRIVALSPMLDKAYGSIDVTAVPPGGKRMSLLKLDGARPRWFYRYWLQDPIEVAKGTTIEVTAVPLADYSDELKSGPSFPLHVNVDYVSQ
jgi:hypothetical protein